MADDNVLSMDAGNVSDMMEAEADKKVDGEAGAESGAESGAEGGQAEVSTDVQSGEVATEAPKADGQAEQAGEKVDEAPKADEAPEAAEAPKADEKAQDAAPAQPELSAVQPAAQAAVDLSPEVAEVLKEVGNKITPLFEKFREADAKLHHLEDEARVRFAHVRQKATEMVAALESWFQRG